MSNNVYFEVIPSVCVAILNIASSNEISAEDLTKRFTNCMHSELGKLKEKRDPKAEGSKLWASLKQGKKTGELNGKTNTKTVLWVEDSEGKKVGINGTVLETYQFCKAALKFEEDYDVRPEASPTIVNWLGNIALKLKEEFAEKAKEEKAKLEAMKPTEEKVKA